MKLRSIDLVQTTDGTEQEGLAKKRAMAEKNCTLDSRQKILKTNSVAKRIFDVLQKEKYRRRKACKSPCIMYAGTPSIIRSVF